MAFNIFATATSDIPLANLDANFTMIGSSAVASTLYPTATTSITYGTTGTEHIFSAGKITGALNGTVGATTPAAGAFTTLSATGNVSFQQAGSNTLLLENTASAANVYFKLKQTTGTTTLGINATATYFDDTAARAYVWYTNGTERARVDTTGLAVTGTLSATGTITASNTTALTVPNGYQTLYRTTNDTSSLAHLILYRGSGAGAYGAIQTTGDAANGVASLNLNFNGTDIAKVSSTGLAVTGTLTSTLGATIYGLTVGRGGGAVSTNTVLGNAAFASNLTGGFSVAIGTQALQVSTAGYNTAVGYQSQLLTNTGQSNVSVGYYSLVANLSGGSNTAIGTYALGGNLTASNNTAVGYQAGYTNQTGATNTFVGTYAGYANTASNNTFIGGYTGYSNQGGNSNVAIGCAAPGGAGYFTFYANQSGNYNTVLGAAALRLNTSGSGNIAIGMYSLNSNLTSDYNTAVGYQALSGTTGGTNTGIGFNSGAGITTGAKNVVVGSYTGSAAPISATGSNYVVLSDGDGNIVASSKTAQTFALQGGTLSTGTGIAFPATQSASTDANTLDDYEEGTWTPNQGSGLIVVGAFSSVGNYVKIGRVVTVQGYLSGATSVSVAGGFNILTSNLPFSCNTNQTPAYAGNGSASTFAGTYVNAFTIASIEAISATSNIYFFATYYTST